MSDNEDDSMNPKPYVLNWSIADILPYLPPPVADAILESMFQRWALAQNEVNPVNPKTPPKPPTTSGAVPNFKIPSMATTSGAVPDMSAMGMTYGQKPKPPQPKAPTPTKPNSGK